MRSVQWFAQEHIESSELNREQSPQLWVFGLELLRPYSGPICSFGHYYYYDYIFQLHNPHPPNNGHTVQNKINIYHNGHTEKNKNSTNISPP